MLAIEPIDQIPRNEPIERIPTDRDIVGIRMERHDSGPDGSLLSLGSARPLAKYIRTIAIAVAMVVLGIITAVTYVNDFI